MKRKLFVFDGPPQHVDLRPDGEKMLQELLPLRGIISLVIRAFRVLAHEPVAAAKEDGGDVKNTVSLAVGAHDPEVLAVILSNHGGAGIGYLQSGGIRKTESERKSARPLGIVIRVAHRGQGGCLILMVLSRVIFSLRRFWNPLFNINFLITKNVSEMYQSKVKWCDVSLGFL